MRLEKFHHVDYLINTFDTKQTIGWSFFFMNESTNQATTKTAIAPTPTLNQNKDTEREIFQTKKLIPESACVCGVCVFS